MTSWHAGHSRLGFEEERALGLVAALPVLALRERFGSRPRSATPVDAAW
ncbi:hypothetical protein ACFV7Q_21230 [Streptomyces sp. NPDC059851]